MHIPVWFCTLTVHRKEAGGFSEEVVSTSTCFGAVSSGTGTGCLSCLLRVFVLMKKDQVVIIKNVRAATSLPLVAGVFFFFFPSPTIIKKNQS